MDSPSALSQEGPVLVLAPHADDETLGCGMALSDRWLADRRAHVVCLTDGAASHPRSRADVAAIRAAELASAVTILGGAPARDLTCLGHPDGALGDVAPEGIVARLGVIADALGARIVAAPSPLDPHCDHVAAAALADGLIATRPTLRLWHYPIWSRWVGRGAAPRLPGARRHSYPVDPARKARAIAAHASQRGGVILDDPDGFAMPPGFAEMFAEGPEIYDERTG
jgi:LmbE family N-acetylglucosaminyl deacetylase